jgi:hypothetical protein
MSKYEPLRLYLENIESTLNEKNISFQEIERVLGFELLRSAHEHRAWWSNPSSKADHPYAQSWLAAGWMVDTVNQNDKWVRFRRIGSPSIEKQIPSSSKKSPSSFPQKNMNGESSRRTLTADTVKFLIELGFEEVGEWLIEEDSLQFSLTRHRNERNILYAFVAQGEVKYIGKSNQTLSRRMSGYKQPGPTQNTNIRINASMKDLLDKNISVQILAFIEKEKILYREVPINLAAGLEDNLIARVRPPWNLRK